MTEAEGREMNTTETSIEQERGQNRAGGRIQRMYRGGLVGGIEGSKREQQSQAQEIGKMTRLKDCLWQEIREMKRKWVDQEVGQGCKKRELPG
jgi:hypothetical protein